MRRVGFSNQDTPKSEPEYSATEMLIGTHDGAFHCDETLACAMHCVTEAVLTHDLMYPEDFFENLLRQPYIQM